MHSLTTNPQLTVNARSPIMMLIRNGVTKIAMSIDQMKTAITKEIDKVNDRIDLKIIKGRAYHKEAQHHRVLLARLRELEFARRRDEMSRRGRVGVLMVSR